MRFSLSFKIDVNHSVYSFNQQTKCATYYFKTKRSMSASLFFNIKAQSMELEKQHATC